MRTFHIGGAASQRAAESTLEGQHEGIVRFKNIKAVKGRDNKLVVISRSGVLSIEDSKGYEREKCPVVLGARLNVKEGDKVKKGKVLAEWDPYTNPIISEAAGAVRFRDLETGVTYKEQVDEVTGVFKRVVVETKNLEMHPTLDVEVRTEDKSKKVEKVPYSLPVGAIIEVADKDDIEAGDVLAKIPRATSKTKDITGGLPTIAKHLSLIHISEPTRPY